TLEQARLAAQRYPERLLCGERHALPPPGFDYGNSPTQFAHIDLGERELILTTTNGSRAFFACPEESTRLAGSFYNASAVTACALRYAQERSGNIAIVCAGEGGYFALDDTACAGFLAREIQRQHAAIEPHESVLAAQAIYEAYPPARILEYGNSARSVIKAGLRADLDFCIQASATSTVPLVEGKEAGTDLLVIRQV
ncbi:MAG: 2-phosphosulfolactate phosphatase, partial [Ktedonobacteraceae bacterium]|nr:2-phosphosulfolactate phosphatase [Ktedonobacteraceae bacterium]